MTPEFIMSLRMRLTGQGERCTLTVATAHASRSVENLPVSRSQQAGCGSQAHNRCEVTPWTVIEKWYKEGKYKPYADLEDGEILIKVIMWTKARVFPWYVAVPRWPGQWYNRT